MDQKYYTIFIHLICAMACLPGVSTGSNLVIFCFGLNIGMLIYVVIDVSFLQRFKNRLREMEIEMYKNIIETIESVEKSAEAQEKSIWEGSQEDQTKSNKRAI